MLLRLEQSHIPMSQSDTDTVHRLKNNPNIYQGAVKHVPGDQPTAIISPGCLASNNFELWLLFNWEKGIGSIELDSHQRIGAIVINVICKRKLQDLWTANGLILLSRELRTIIVGLNVSPGYPLTTMNWWSSLSRRRQLQFEQMWASLTLYSMVSVSTRCCVIFQLSSHPTFLHKMMPQLLRRLVKNVQLTLMVNGQLSFAVWLTWNCYFHTFRYGLVHFQGW